MATPGVKGNKEVIFIHVPQVGPGDQGNGRPEAAFMEQSGGGAQDLVRTN